MVVDAVKDCLTMHVQEDRLDAGVGRSTKLGCRNLTKKGDENMAFGLSTQKLNAMNNKVLEQTSIAEIISPAAMDRCKISEEEMAKQRRRSDVMEVLQTIGLNYRHAMFEGVWRRAVESEAKNSHENVTRQTASMNAVVRAIKELKAMRGD